MRTSVLIHTLLIFAAATSACSAEEKARTPEEIAQIQADFRKKLERKVSCEFTDDSFEDALNFINSLLKVGVIMGSHACEAAAGRRITLKFENARFSDVLDKMCELGGLHWELRERLYITSKEEFQKSVELAIYDVRGLCRTTEELGFDWFLVEGEKAKREAMKEFKARQKDEEKFVASIRALSPEAWKDDLVCLELRGGKLVVMQTPAVHATIAGYVAKLRKEKEK